MLTKLQFRPGINREVTNYSNEGGWVDCDKVRFRAGFPESIGGWSKLTEEPFLGTCRSLIGWSTLTGAKLTGLGTNLKYYIERGGALNDITPIRRTSDAGDVTFSATDGSSVVTISDTFHGARDNDFVTFSGAVSLGGNVTASVLNAEHQITEVVDNDTYTVALSVTANSSDTGDGGTAVVGEYQINVGLAEAFRGDGWGAGGWGEGGWGEAADTTIAGEGIRLWSNTNFGEALIINPRGGGLYLWDPAIGFGTRADLIADRVGADEVPAQVNMVDLSEKDRHVIAFGCTPLGGGDLDPLLIRFSAQEDFLDWQPKTTNTAGDLRISSGNQIVAVAQTSQQKVLLTDSSLHTMQFIGPPFTFGITEVAAGLSSAGPNCAVSANDTVFWMGLGEFYAYDGTVRQIPCSVKEYVFDLTFDRSRRDLVFAGHNSSYSEIWWFYPCKNETDCTRYVVYNYEQQVWYYGSLGRTAWIDRGTFLSPTASGTDGFLYSHEVGVDDGSTNPPSPLEPYIQSSPVDIGDGEQFMFVSGVVPDVTFRGESGTPSLTLTMSAQNFPGSEIFGHYPSQISRTVSVDVEIYTKQLFIRLRGRSVVLRIESSKVGTAWRLGFPRIRLRTDGRR